MQESHQSEKKRLTQEQIHAFLKSLHDKGLGAGSLQSYEIALSGLYEFLPEEKYMDADTGVLWKSWLEEQGLLPRTVNAKISVWNSFVQFLGYRQWQVVNFHHGYEEVQPELTRTEYLRLLQTARQMEKKKTYLLIKIMGGAGIRIQELSQLTVESVNRGILQLESHNCKQKRMVRLLPVLRQELLTYARGEGIKSGPIFVTGRGTPLPRSRVYYLVNSISHDARVDEEKANPRCLWKMYQTTYEGIRANIDLLTEQAYERMVEEEQISVGWDAS